MNGDLERMRVVLSQTFLSQQYDAWVQLLGPYSDLCDELGLDQEAWLAREVTHVEEDSVVCLRKPGQMITYVPTVIGSWLGFPDRVMFISQKFLGHLRISIDVERKRYIPFSTTEYDVELWDAFDIPKPVKGY